jgi:Na+/proline symporter
MAVIATILIYFAVLLGVSRWTGRKATNDTFFRGERRSPWPMVAFGMVGASISGVSFVSVPGMVLSSQMTYLQLCLGFILGYLAVAFVLLPVYYRLRLTSIYSLLGQRLGRNSYVTGAGFFLLSKLMSTAVKFYVVCLLMQQFVMQPLGVPFFVTTTILIALIWLYTRKGGVRTLVFTDSIQTLSLFSALVLIIFIVMSQMGLSPLEAIQTVWGDERSTVFVFSGWGSPQNFWKMLLSGAFIVVVMTGLDQDMMQKNLTCRTLREAQKNMCTYGMAFLPANLLFLALGVLLAIMIQTIGMPLPLHGDELLTTFVGNADAFGLTETTSTLLLVLFTLGLVASSFSSADSALTSLTTSYCVDIRQSPDNESLRKRTHLAMCALLVVAISVIRVVNSTSLIDTIYTIVSYTYGPLLGLFAFSLFTARKVHDRLVPVVCAASPLLCLGIESLSRQLWDYRFGYELLMLNGTLTFLGLLIISWRHQQTPA